MGCDKLNKINFLGKGRQINNKIIILLIGVMLVTAITPVVLAASQANIAVTFDPTGTIDLDVSPDDASFGSVVFESTNNYPTEGGLDTSYTLYNNGTVAADVYIFSNTTTDSGQMTLDDDGAAIPVDGYSLDVTGSDAQYITHSNTSWVNALAASGTVTFGLNLDLGSGSQDWTSQTTRINITGTINT